MKSFPKIAAVTLLILFAGFSLHTLAFSFFGVKPNILLAILVTLAILRIPFLHYVFYAFLATFIVGFPSFFTIPETFFFIVFVFVAFLVAHWISWKAHVQVVVFITVLTVLFSFAASGFGFSIPFSPLILEVFYNTVFGFVALYAFQGYRGSYIS